MKRSFNAAGVSTRTNVRAAGVSTRTVFTTSLAILAMCATACVEQSREKKKYGRTFESTRIGASMPFNYAPLPKGRWIDTTTELKINAAPDLSGIRPRR